MHHARNKRAGRYACKGFGQRLGRRSVPLARSAGAETQHAPQVSHLVGLELDAALGKPPNAVTPGLLPQFQVAPVMGCLAQHDFHLLAIASARQGSQDNFRKGLH